MLLVTFMMMSRGIVTAEPTRIAAFVLAFVFVNVIFFLMIYTGRTDRYRATLFITYAVAFIISFISHLIEERGSMALTQANMISGQSPFCHIVIPMTLIPAALTKTIIFPGTIVGTYASVASMFVLWIGASLALGRGFCAWGCFFGGLEDGFSRLLKKPVITRINRTWSYLPYAVLLAIVLSSAIWLTPTYCMWLCPFKTVTEFVEITSVKILIQTIIFLSLFIGLVIVLPVLTKRRTQCGLFCPFGAFQSFTNKVNAFDIRVDADKCVQCGRCIRACPVFAIDGETIAEGGTRITCTKCGKCVDVCPKKAISFHVKGTTLSTGRDTCRVLFLYPAFLFLTTMAGSSLIDAVVRIIRLVTTGSMLV
jgi:polyferredoxin